MMNSSKNEDVLDIENVPSLGSDAVADYHYQSYKPYTQSMNNNDEIRITMNNSDVYTLTSDSYVMVRGKIVKADDGKTASPCRLANNGPAFLFSEIRYLINNVLVDSCRNVGVTSSMKLYPSYNANEATALAYAGWNPTGNNDWMQSDGSFEARVPLRLLLGFAEHHRKPIVHMKEELQLIRARSDDDAILSVEEGAATASKVLLEQVTWHVPHLRLKDKPNLTVMRALNANKALHIRFLTRELHEIPLLPTSATHSWSVKSAPATETPRYVIFGLQTDRRFKLKKEASHFDHCDLRDVRLYLNGVFFPYENMDEAFSKNRFATLYAMFCNFQSSFYGNEPMPLLSPAQFKTYAPLVVIDCSSQKDITKTAPIDIRIDFELRENAPPMTAAYCLIMSEREFEYRPVSNLVTAL